MPRYEIDVANETPVSNRFGFPSVRRTLVILFGAFALVSGSATAQDTFYAAVTSLKNTTDEVAWRRLEKPLTELRKNIEKQAGRLPYEKPDDVPSFDSMRGIANASPGAHSLWMDFRIVSVEPPPSNGYINRCMAVIHSDLRADEKAPANRYKPKDRRHLWDGYIHSSIVIVDGSIDMDGYIANSIVLCTGPVKIQSYIANSLVISCYEGDDFSVDTRSGYINHSIVAAKKCRPNSARDCIIFGEVDGTDLRAADIKSWHMVSESIKALGIPARDYSQPEPVIAKGPGVASKLAALLATEDQIKAGMIAEELSDAILTKEQVSSLIENATSTTSDARRNAIWHTIRLSRDIAGQKYLRETLSTTATPQQRIRFIQSIKNPTIDDVPLLTDIYDSGIEEALDKNTRKELDDVREQVVRVACIDWKKMVIDTSRSPELSEAESAERRTTYDRRQDRALEGQASIVRWLVRHGATDDHRLRAYAAMFIVTGWPNEHKWLEQTSLKEDLLASSPDPTFRVKVLEKFGNSMPLAQFLDPQAGEVDVVRIAAIRAIRKLIFQEQQALVGYSGQYTSLLNRVAREDEAASVREAASQLLEEFRVDRAR